ncbi:MAG: uracil-DNA glycosylase, partial [Methyloprofundus sp.]|nr:uracil-DNA glycosylase [Methyloprofundus sp.]
MDNTTRLQYLAAMGIDVWVPRHAEGSRMAEDFPVAVEADSWESLQAEMVVCQQCDLSQSRQQVVLGSGNQQADFLWVTEAPSLEDDQQGIPFADHSGE